MQKSLTAHASAVEGMPPPTPCGHLPHPSTKEAGHSQDVTEMVISGGGPDSLSAMKGCAGLEKAREPWMTV